MENEIKDSGEMRTFNDLGCHRDASTGKGRMDLIPLMYAALLVDEKEIEEPVFAEVYLFTRDYDINHIAKALKIGIDRLPQFKNLYDAMLQVSHLYQGGAEKYGECNWTRAMPLEVLIDSGLRHYCKAMGDIEMDQEPHHRGFVWNMLCLMWTAENIPDAIDNFKKHMECWGYDTYANKVKCWSCEGKQNER